jgi:hypothetical protein
LLKIITADGEVRATPTAINLNVVGFTGVKLLIPARKGNKGIRINPDRQESSNACGFHSSTNRARVQDCFDVKKL